MITTPFRKKIRGLLLVGLTNLNAMAQLEINRPLPTMVARHAEESLSAFNAMDAARAMEEQTKLKLLRKQQKVEGFLRKTAKRSAHLRAAAAEVRRQNNPPPASSGRRGAARKAATPRGVPGSPSRRRVGKENVPAGGAAASGGLGSPYPSTRPVEPASDQGSLASSAGLEIPEGCELARRIVVHTEQHCAVWVALQARLESAVKDDDE